PESPGARRGNRRKRPSGAGAARFRPANAGLPRYRLSSLFDQTSEPFPMRVSLKLLTVLALATSLSACSMFR
ncbi:hypothetical protein, partial [Frateuria defendens]|uniref:hypothetical protein n=1 Tax=Frateuria defendens TaxID=2219559 RepID=UPI001F2712E5